MQITWSEDLRTGHTEIDRQHRYLINQANHLLELIEAETDKTERRRLLDSLVDYVKQHYKLEEDLMNECDFPDRGSHLAEHEEFFRVIDVFLRRQQAGEEVTAIGLNHLFMNWFLDHIRDYDCALVAHARNHAISNSIPYPSF